MTFGPLPAAERRLSPAKPGPPKSVRGHGARTLAGLAETSESLVSASSVGDGVHVRKRTRGHIVPGARDCYALAALLLDYPDDDLVSRREALLEAARALTPSGSARGLVAFCEWFAQADPDALRVEYVRTFDHKRRNALYMTFAAHGDMRRRGEALLAFKSLYRANGFVVREDELPDFLPMVLQFAAQAPQRATAVALDMARPGIELVARSLTDSGSPWARVVAAVRDCLPPVDAEGERQLASVMVAGPPTELVGAGAGAQPEGAGR